MRRSSLFLAAVTLVVAACSGDRTPITGPLDIAPPSLTIADAGHGYRAGFYWLQPMVLQPGYGGVFDAGLSPVVEICELVGETCGQLIARYTMTEGPGGEVVKLSVLDEHYMVNWATSKFTLNTAQLYRVYAYAGGVLLGYADVQLVDNGSGFKNVDTGEKIGLLDGRTLPIKFRVETGMLGQIVVQPGEATAQPGGTQQFVAELRDLHGNPLTASVTWSESDETVATVDQAGLATAVAGGVATISASRDRMVGSATFTVAGLTRMLATAGGDHSCVVDGTGRTWCWGEGNLGEIGDGGALDRTGPIFVAGAPRLAVLEAGRFHNCGITASGDAWCWGYNLEGQLGVSSNGTFCAIIYPCATLPLAVPGGFRFASISAGVKNTCGITATGETWCWGEGLFGALGNGTRARRSPPVQVSGGLVFAAVSAGLDAVCGITPEGQAHCWGSGGDGKLGNGSTTTRLTPFPVGGGLTFAAIDVGWMQTCALTPAGKAYCWGIGAFGALGTGTTATQLLPAAVAGSLTFASITAGDQHTCALTPEGQAWCWGTGTAGQLGIGPVGSDPRRLTPVPVTGGLTFASLTAGTTHTCGVTTDGRTYCWGAGAAGQLGTGNGSGNQFSPVPVAAMN